MTIELLELNPFKLVPVGLIALTGCAGHSDFMIKVPSGTADVAPVADRATVAFIRDSGFGFAVNFSIIDQSGNVLGDAVARSHFALQLPAGRYFFFAPGGENTDVIQADVGTGRVYYVHVIPRFGAWLARVELDPIKPNERDAGSLQAWLAATDHLVPLIPKAAASTAETPLPDWASRAWSSLSAVDRAEHTIAPDDGWPVRRTQPSAPPTPVAAAWP